MTAAGNACARRAFEAMKRAGLVRSVLGCMGAWSVILCVAMLCAAMGALLFAFVAALHGRHDLAVRSVLLWPVLVAATLGLGVLGSWLLMKAEEFPE